MADTVVDAARQALPPEFTAQAWQLLGPDKLLVVGLSVPPDADRDETKAAARETVSGRVDSTAVAAELRAHLTAGADHVTLLLPIGYDFASGIGQLEQLAPVLVGLGDRSRASRCRHVRPPG
ncbi:MAG TPA: hypothetical protein VFI55_04915 [Mycobacterium sp.]|nr:hypothetical protein [Mycobacterium sp.]